MSMPLLPMWLRIVWVVALCGVIVTHVGHAVAMPGQRRWWHVGHTAMAAGMALMYLLPRMQHPALYRAGLVLFVLIMVAEAAATAVFRRREGMLNPLWLLSAVDMFAMAYMLLAPAARPVWLTWVLVAYLGGQVLGWAFGLWDRLPVFARGLPATVAPGDSPTAVERTHRHEHAVTPLADDPAPEAAPGPVVGLTAHSTVAVRVTLAVMAAGMAYMLAIM
ncbi:DUF5134 domain-containing protein [Haloactinomyces albus]|uniref:DUF5134 domain-containing protein n=1 Tax=Haloactinomyces albus TaxID=1352928 RepID=A0AAE4CNA6_9ACTN|nr:DUF5134 domain-containing protein [Haloactinomyces albus]MDR7303699.1 hypothetical protein [Haloactinomyces albus]